MKATKQDDPAVASATGGEGERRVEVGLDRGARIGRYTLIDQIGRGGMGVIWAAYDPQLDRKIALKLLLVETEASRTRLLREAQALAKLTHPNVVTIYDTGVQDEQVWIAMEFIDGQTLREWLKAKPRDWRAVRAVMLEAGKGLAAAHEKGLVHRDFKPENVMLDGEGRVRVMDFGLVGREDGVGVDDDEEDRGTVEYSASMSSIGIPIEICAEEDISRPFDTDVTGGGGVMGTPAYMAPEQHLGVATDARADQFGFCVSLWESLYGQRPFVGTTLDTLAHSVCEGEISEPPRGAEVPTWLRRVAERGLAPKRDARYASMDELLDALAYAPSSRWRIAVALGVVVVLAAGLGVWTAIDKRQTKLACEQEAAAIGASWSPSQAEQVAAAFDQTGLASASDAWQRTEDQLDKWAARWSVVRRRVCIEAELDGTRELASSTRTRACLDHQRAGFDELVAGLGEVDRDTIHAAVLSAAELGDPGDCLDEAQARVVVPDAPELAAAVAELRQGLHRVGALRKLGRAADSGEAAKALLERAVGLEWPPIEAEALVELAEVEVILGAYEDAEDHLERAFLLAGQFGDEVLMAEAATTQVRVVGDYQARYAEGLHWGRLAGLYLERTGRLESSEYARLATVNGRVLQLAGRYDEVAAAFAQARALIIEVLGPDHPRLAGLLNNLSSYYQARGEYQLALDSLAEARTIYERVLGAEHPRVAVVLNNMANAYSKLGRNREALDAYVQALALREAAFGPDHPDVATALSNLGTGYLALGRAEQAREVTERALAIREAKLGPEHPRVATTLNNLGEIFAALGQLDKARAHYQRALDIRKAALGPTHAQVGSPLNNLGKVYVELGQLDAALTAHEQALAIYVGAFGPRHADVAETRKMLAVVLRERHDLDGAEAMLAEALDVELEQFGRGSLQVAQTEFELGRVDEARGKAKAALAHFEAALAGFEAWDAPPPAAIARAQWAVARVSDDRQRGRELALAAREALAALDARDELAAIDVWLRTHPR